MLPPLAPRPVLCLVVDRKLDRHPLEEAVEAASRAGIDWLQLRERDLDSADWLDWARALLAASRRGDARPRVMVNQRCDIALALGADGVHLGFDAVAPRVARSLLGPEALIGRSTHSPDEVARAAVDGAHYAQLAPILDPLSKRPERPALGVEALAEAARHGLPVLAQGGVEAQHCAELLAAGAFGIALTGSILLAPDPGAATARLRRALDDAVAAD